MLARPLWFTFGCAATGCGIAGAVLPLLPTTPFLLVAAWAFARSSPRLHGWLLAHPTLGRLINNWQHDGSLGRNTKLVAMLVMLSSLGLTLLLGFPMLVAMVQLMVFVPAGWFLLSRPEPLGDTVGEGSPPVIQRD
ncbi:MAG: YbaN family protein [Gammaproteobacteria bacterium]|nr:YbaN family protein [Gammaproteobacteria bacterium]